MLDAVYVAALEEKRVVAIKTKPAFRPLLEILSLRPEGGITLAVLPELGYAPCFW